MLCLGTDSKSFHLLLKKGTVSITTVMRKLLTGYAVTFNRRHRRVGHLFQNRYKSILCQEDSYLLELVRYIHLNPLRAGLVGSMKQLDRFTYSGHSCLMGQRKNDWQDTDLVLKLFGKRVSSARKHREFVEKGIAMETVGFDRRWLDTKCGRLEGTESFQQA